MASVYDEEQSQSTSSIGQVQTVVDAHRRYVELYIQRTRVHRAGEAQAKPEWTTYRPHRHRVWDRYVPIDSFSDM